MPTIDEFSRPKEWIPEDVQEYAMRIRKEWTEKEVFPARRQLDDDWKDHDIMERLYKKLAVDLGFQKLLWPKELGGLGMDSLVAHCLLTEEIGRGDLALCTAAYSTSWPFTTVALHPESNGTLMKKMASFYCDTRDARFTSPAIGDAPGVVTTARLDGNEWVINGHKKWASNGGGEADIVAITADTEDGMAILFVPADTPGVTQGPPEYKAGLSADYKSDVIFENVRIPKENRAGGPGEGEGLFREFFCWGNVVTAGYVLGAMKNVYEIVKDFTTESASGGCPLKDQSINAAVLGEIAMLIDVTESETYAKARMVDRTDLYAPATSQEMLAKTRVTKLFATDAITRVTNLAMDLMGWPGYTRGYDVEKHWRDSKVTSIWMGGRQAAVLDIARWFYECKGI